MHIAKLFKNGNSQAVRIPKDYRFEGNEVYINRVDNMIVEFTRVPKPKLENWAS